MVSQLVKHERIENTVAKAKQVRRIADNMVQLGKDTLHAACVLLLLFVVMMFFINCSRSLLIATSGYTRLRRTFIRMGDAAPMAYIEFTYIICMLLRAPSDPRSKSSASQMQTLHRKLIRLFQCGCGATSCHGHRSIK